MQSVITVERPLDEVFEFAADLDSLPLWLEGCKKAWSPDGDGRSIGSEILHEDEFMGRSFEARFEVVEWEHNRRMVFKAVSGPFRGLSEEDFYDESGDTRVEIRVSGEPAGFLKALGFMAKRQGQAQLERSLDNLKRVLEAHA
ncbi:MAG: SRPBCC family protein [Actinomycetota bacterium]|nr:SRPBCC family protein [Actinomycetota bacterium]